MPNILITSPQTVAYINGNPFAFVTGFNYQDSRPHKIINGIDTLLPLDMVPGPVSYTASMQLLRRRLGGGIEGEGMAPTWGAATRGKFFSFLLIDKETDTVLFEGQKNIITAQQWSIAIRQFVTGSVTFTGMYYSNGAESPVG